MADILRQVRFAGIDVEEEERKTEKRNRERAANRRRKQVSRPNVCIPQKNLN